MNTQNLNVQALTEIVATAVASALAQAMPTQPSEQQAPVTIDVAPATPSEPAILRTIRERGRRPLTMDELRDLSQLGQDTFVAALYDRPHSGRNVPSGKAFTNGGIDGMWAEYLTPSGHDSHYTYINKGAKNYGRFSPTAKDNLLIAMFNAVTNGAQSPLERIEAAAKNGTFTVAPTQVRQVPTNNGLPYYSKKALDARHDAWLRHREVISTFFPGFYNEYNAAGTSRARKKALQSDFNQRVYDVTGHKPCGCGKLTGNSWCKAAQKCATYVSDSGYAYYDKAKPGKASERFPNMRQVFIDGIGMLKGMTVKAIGQVVNVEPTQPVVETPVVESTPESAGPIVTIGGQEFTVEQARVLLGIS